MMNEQMESLTFTVNLGLAAHSRAEEFRRRASNPGKAKQVYLNGLAVYAVDYYLQCLGYETDWNASDSASPAMQLLLNIADLEVKHNGKLECLPVLPGASAISIPPEVREDRIGYVAVQLDDSLRAATLLGFSKTAGRGVLSLGQLQSLEDLLGQLRYRSEKPFIDLQQWLQGLFEGDWQPGNLVLAPSFRGASRIATREIDLPEGSISRAKLIEVGEENPESVALVVNLNPKTKEEIDIKVGVHAIGDRPHLPDNLVLKALNQQGVAVMEAHSGSANRYMTLKFSAEPGEDFAIRVEWGELSVTENFII